MVLIKDLERRVDALENRVKFCMKYANFLQFDAEFEGRFMMPLNLSREYRGFV